MKSNRSAQSTIMIVDDTPANLKLLEYILRQKAGYRVQAFRRGRKALEAALRNPPDLILLDIAMPEMDGFEVCKRLKAAESLKDIPVIFISALSETASKLNSFALGGVDYVSKPFHVEEVLARVHTHLELVHREKTLKANYAELEKLERHRDGLIHLIVHDMQTPLMIIRGNLELAKLEPLPEPAEQRIGDALAETETILEMISSLLDIGKMESGMIATDVQPVNLDSLAGKVIQTVKPLQGKRTLLLNDSDKTAHFTRCDARLIRRVLLNFITNAIKFTDDEDGYIGIDIQNTPSGKVRVAVTDNGPGIPENALDKIFEKFYQVTAKQLRHHRSTGLGLTFCKLAVEVHGGQIGVDSREEKGVRFWFELPRYDISSNSDNGLPFV